MLDTFREWLSTALADGVDGEEVTVSLVDMTDAEVAELPEL